MNGVVTVCKIDGSIRFQINNHFRPSNPADKSVHVARLVVLRIGHELNAAIIEATHPGHQYTLACLGFQASRSFDGSKGGHVDR